MGATDTDEIAVTNEGTAMDTNIRIECLASLAPNQTGRWRVVVRAVSREDVRFKVSLKTDQFSRPVEETEATNQY